MTKKLPERYKIYRISVRQKRANEARAIFPQYIWVDEDMLIDRGFCSECENVEEEADLDFSSCPAGWDMRDKACTRNHLCQEIFEIVDALNERLDEVCGFSAGDRIFIDSINATGAI